MNKTHYPVGKTNFIVVIRLSTFNFSIEAINQEKTIQNIESFDKRNLRRSVTEEKNILPDKESMYYKYCITLFHSLLFYKENVYITGID